MTNQREKESWIVFLDLLGTKDSAKISSSQYPLKIETFSHTLLEHAQNIQADVKVRFFADSVYLQCGSFSELVDFVAAVRWTLFSEQIFFKAAIARGELEDRPIVQHVTEGRLHPFDVSGSFFGPAAVGVYYAQESFKGIGFTIEKNALKADQVDRTCHSAFPVDDEASNWVAFRDIRHGGGEIGGPIPSVEEIEEQENTIAFLDTILEAALRANTKRKNLARYYLSQFISCIQSSNFENIDFHDRQWRNFPPIFYHVFMNQSTRKGYQAIRGSRLLFFLIAAKVLETNGERSVPRYKDTACNAVCNEVVRALVSQKLTTEPFSKIPGDLIASDVLEDLGRRSVSLRMRGH
ncbi:hypothetical protein [Szabonella alba]|uniref:Uncharacterized protein n=1 Tax=Szabonella alba TaxID=2804194 RepID=A0A8K0Y173_9RHOB|nr:hypothetical protein [Szabonella alba]MBL4918556.1 hypothetical protein [Szabonella alba]